MTIHRGGVGQRPNRLSATYPVQANVTIYSGQVITPYRNTTVGIQAMEWILGAPIGAGNNSPNSYYIAVDDSTDGDVLAAGNLQGLSVRGCYEISSAWVDEASVVVGDPLTPSLAKPGYFRKATLASDIVIAHVVQDYSAPVDLDYDYSSLLPEAGGVVTPGVQGAVYTRPKETNAQSLLRVRMELVQPYKYASSL